MNGGQPFRSGTKLSGVTGATDPIWIKGKFSLNLSFASTGSVTLQRRGQVDTAEYNAPANPTDQTWVDVTTYTASIADEGESGGKFEYRLNFTALAGDIEYWLGGSI